MLSEQSSFHRVEGFKKTLLPCGGFFAGEGHREEGEAVAGEPVGGVRLPILGMDGGTRKITNLIRTWCALKMWHLQFNIVNKQTLLDAQRMPDNYRSLLVCVAGYSVYFCDLSRDL